MTQFNKLNFNSFNNDNSWSNLSSSLERTYKIPLNLQTKDIDNNKKHGQINSTNSRKKIQSLSSIQDNSHHGRDFVIKSPIPYNHFFELASLFDSYAHNSGDEALITKSLEEGISNIASKMNEILKLKSSLKHKLGVPIKIYQSQTKKNEEEVHEQEINDIDFYDFMTQDQTAKSEPELSFSHHINCNPKISIDHNLAQDLLDTATEAGFPLKGKRLEDKLENYITFLALAFHNLQETIISPDNSDDSSQFYLAPKSEKFENEIDSDKWMHRYKFDFSDVFNSRNISAEDFLSQNEEIINKQKINFIQDHHRMRLT